MSSEPPSSFLARPGFLAALYAGNALWHSSAFIHFTFQGPRMMRKLSLRGPKSISSYEVAPTAEGDAWHHDILAYLGGINTGFVILSGLRVYAWWQGRQYNALSTGRHDTDIPLDVIALSTLCVANASQAVLNLTKSRSSGRWIMGRGLDRITVLDAVFAVLDAAALWARLA